MSIVVQWSRAPVSVSVRALRGFHWEGRDVAAGDTLTVTSAEAYYLEAVSAVRRATTATDDRSAVTVATVRVHGDPQPATRGRGRR